MKLEWVIRDDLITSSGPVNEAEHSSQLANLSLLYRCLGADIISKYTFSESWSFLGDPAEAEKYLVALYEGFKTVLLLRENRFVSGGNDEW
jgi:hypothetical protein